MKGTILSGVLAASLLLTGCASMLTREYGSVEPHSATLVSEGDANTLRAESYQDVVNGLIYFINRGAESGSIRFDGEEPDVRALLDEALATLSGSTEVQVFLRAEDLPLAQALQASCGGARRLTFREGGFQLGGLVAESEQLGLRVDSSFDSAAGELSGHFAELFGISLSDDDSPEGGNAQ